ncbi:protein FAN-like isoform X1 [Cimex lectularius]|uniref:Protein FAN n=1 Tax=Cimex lectularius TaxID=79782 RepID=A0A8I6RXG5_CIMLE|nr:protein FAN-like isoform X1 [Cimex lectularius]
MDKHRFSLLLLEPGEIYFEDYSVHFQSTDGKTPSEIGRLKVCSKSLVFDPQNHHKPIVKLLLKECTEISRYETNDSVSTSPHLPGYLTIVQGYVPDFQSENDANTNVLQVNCKQHIEISEGNVLAPYKFKNFQRTFLFSLNYAHIKDCLPLVSQLHRASTLPAAEQNQMVAAIELSRQSLVKFDPLWLQDVDEHIVLETTGNKVTPLVMNHGRVILSTTTLYYQPFNKIEPYHILKISLLDIKSITKRRFLLQHVGLEISYKDTHLYLSLKTKSDRDLLYDCLLAQPLNLVDSHQEIMTLQWQNGAISNYEYLLYLNSQADRTFNDLTQYPVFPWVISDYTSSQLDLSNARSFRDLSKPIGALNLERFQKLKERYDEMPPPKFLYGSHYSAPGFVLFYLVRKYPHYMLCLQNGRFDHPDRMFNSISDVWRNVQTNMSDFKELVPEFYDVSNEGDFLDNLKGIQFGYRHDGTKVNNVTLPPWAEDRADFVRKLRDALESDYASAQLHDWIDLIFGYKQRGEEAEKANNVFYYLCYEGSVNLEGIKDWNERHSKEVQIMEFGQVPKQIFTQPHPRRHCAIPPSVSPTGKFENTLIFSLQLIICFLVNWRNLEDMAISAEISCHKMGVTALSLSSDGRLVASVSSDSTLKIHNAISATRERSVNLSGLPLTAVLILNDSTTVLAGSMDSTLIVYDVECGRIVERVRGHEDAVSCLAWAPPSLVLTGSWDCSVRVWKLRKPLTSIKPASDLIAQLDHDDKIMSIAVNNSYTLLATGTSEGEIFLWSLKSFSIVKSLPGHKEAVNSIQFSADGTKLVTCSDDRTLKVYDLCTGTVVFSKCLIQKLKCLAWDGKTLLIGGAHGSLYLWDLVNVTLVKEIKAHNGAILSICVADDGGVVVTGGEDKKLKIWR